MTDHYSLQPEIGTDDELFMAIITLDKKRIRELKANGAALTETVLRILENGPRRSESASVHHPEYYFRYSLVRAFKEMPTEKFRETAAMLRAEIGKPLHYSEAVWLWENKRAFEPGFFDVTLENFDQKRMSKKKTMKEIIDKNALGCLPVCEKHGWLKMPKTRDELTEYANEKGKTEAVAWLLEFKNRTADLAAERERAEKKMQRELNADPNSVTALKKIWRFSKLEDADRMSAQGRPKAAGCRQKSDLGGTLEITCYKGERTEVIVPERIGKDTVTAIGVGAFTGELYCAVRTPAAVCEKRVGITKITLPETITYIDKQAFCGLPRLAEVNIPKSVTEILFQAFFECRSLAEIKLSGGLTFIGRDAFGGCPNLTAVVYRGSYAERYCKENNIKFKYAEE